MAEGNQYLVGSLERVGEQLNRRSVYAPALVVLLNEQVPADARHYVEKILDGEGVFWDIAPLRGESWEVYAGLTGFYSQLLRLLCRDVALDVWEGWGRSLWVTTDWYPMSRDFGWKVACRPLRGVFFRHEEPPFPQASRYIASWPHGWMTLEECKEHSPYLYQHLVDLAPRIGLEWTEIQIEDRLRTPEHLSRDERFEINNLCAGRREEEVWQFQRSLVLLEAMQAAIDQQKDLISVGY